MATNGGTTKAVAPTQKQKSVSETFTGLVMREFGSTVSSITLSPYQKKLAQHLFIKIDATLKDLEAKRAQEKPNNTPILWQNLNMQKLAVDAMHRIELGLDALIPNHISPIPYFNSKTEKYDLDLRVGFVGKDYYRRQSALEPPEDIIYELVYETDHFKPIKRSSINKIESYEFEIKEPFKRGNVVGGFAYVVYGDPKKNFLVIVTEADFLKSKSKGNKVFWENYPTEMRFKTIVNRATSRLQMDPEKINAAFRAVEAAEDAVDARLVNEEIAEAANKGKVIEIESIKTDLPESESEPTKQATTEGDQQPPEEPKAAAEQRGPGF